MISLSPLVSSADPNCRTDILQTPAHFAVRGDSVEALQLLIEAGSESHEFKQFSIGISRFLFNSACYNSRDGADERGRTPLQLAAELGFDASLSELKILILYFLLFQIVIMLSCFCCHLKSTQHILQLWTSLVIPHCPL